MRVLLNIPDHKAPPIMEVLKGLKYIKVNTLSSAKAQILEGIKEAVDEVKQHKRGKRKLKTAQQLLNEL